MRPPGEWGPNEFAQFTEGELHETMMGAMPGSNYYEWAKAELEHRERRIRTVPSNTGGPNPGVPLVTYNVVNIGTAVHSPVQQGGARSMQSQGAVPGCEERPSLVRLVDELTAHLDELSLDAGQERKANAQIATLRAQLTDEPDPAIVRQAGRTLRNITEGAIASLVAAAAQPTVWHWVQEAMVALFPN